MSRAAAGETGVRKQIEPLGAGWNDGDARAPDTGRELWWKPCPEEQAMEQTGQEAGLAVAACSKAPPSPLLRSPKQQNLPDPTDGEWLQV